MHASEARDAANLAVGLDPSQMRELGVHGDAEDLGVDGLELGVAIGELRAGVKTYRLSPHAAMRLPKRELTAVISVGHTNVKSRG